MVIVFVSEQHFWERTKFVVNNDFVQKKRNLDKQIEKKTLKRTWKNDHFSERTNFAKKKFYYWTDYFLKQTFKKLYFFTEQTILLNE